MPFIRRDAKGKVEAVFHKMKEEGLEEVPLDNPDLAHFLYLNQLDAAVNKEFTKSDLSLVRVLEDLVDLLIEKDAFRFTDLPEMAQQKLLGRRGLRKELSYVETLFGHDEDEATFMEGESDGGGFL
jgi:hypothetical protein